MIAARTYGWNDADIRGIQAPTLITMGDGEMVHLEHAIALLRLRGGDVNSDFDGVPASQLAVFPGTTHFSGPARPGRWSSTPSRRSLMRLRPMAGRTSRRRRADPEESDPAPLDSSYPRLEPA